SLHGMPGNLTLCLCRHHCPLYGATTSHGGTSDRERLRRPYAVGARRVLRRPVTRTYGVGVLSQHSAEQGRDCFNAEVRVEPDQDVPCACAGGDFLDAFACSQTELKATFEGL